MKNVIVYRDGTVLADGVRLTHVVDIEVPTFKPGHDVIFPRLTIDVVGTLTYSEHKYSSIPAAPPVVSLTADGVRHLYEANAIDYATYLLLLDQLGYKGERLVPPPPKPMPPAHPDTARVAAVKRVIDTLHHNAKISTATKNDLLACLL